MVITAHDTQLKPGYKQTEVGVIPEDWVVKTLGDMVNKERPICYGIVQTGKSVDNGVSCIRVVDLDNGKIKKENLITTSDDISNSYKRTILEEGDLVIALRGKIGELAIIDKELIRSNLTRGVALIAVKDSLNSSFFLQQLSSYNSKVIFERNLNGSALQEIPINVLRKIPVAYPRAKSEQTAIATVLSDTDSLITSLDKLIAKKRDIKQAMMQQLLTGKTRLPGFSEEWQIKNLGEITEIIMGQSPVGTSYNRDGYGYPLINGPTEFTDRHPIKIQWTNQPTKFCKKNDILVCVRGSSTGRINIANDDYCIGRGIAAIRAKAGVDAQYITFQVDCAVKNILALTTGSTFPNIDGKSIRSIEFQLPAYSEQQAIAAILIDMDSEIVYLEQKRDKIRALKQGMMQELLTGKTRLG